MEPRQHYNIRISGRVQGVGFRWSASREAKDLGICGFVKNLPDGDVYAEAEGSRVQLDRFVDWCRRSPGLSEVKSVEVQSAQPRNYTEFRIED